MRIVFSYCGRLVIRELSNESSTSGPELVGGSTDEATRFLLEVILTTTKG